MNCEQVRELLSMYLDNTLVSTEHALVATHLQNCAVCSSILADFREGDALLSHLPRIAPHQTLRTRIFSSPEYLQLTGTSGSPVVRRTRRSQLVALPGGRTSSTTPTLPMPRHRQPFSWGLPMMHIIVAASILLLLAMGSFIGWNVWQGQNKATQDPNGITPPASLQQGPLPAGTRFVFLRDDALWSASTDGGRNVVRLTPQYTTVAANWVVRTALPGNAAGNMLAYIDLQQGALHTIRSDGQSDTVIRLPLLKAGIQPTSVWDTETGRAILSSLTWSKNGSMLAFVADPHGTESPGLYIYSVGSGEIHEVPLPFTGAVSHPVWSPDGIRVAFEIHYDGKVGILDYNTQNHGLLTITPAINIRDPNDTVLALDWSSAVDIPMITWSVGTIGHVHSIWAQRVGIEDTAGPQALLMGDYAQAIYTRQEHNNTGSWVVVTTHAGIAGDILSVDLSSVQVQLTQGKHVNAIDSSPDGTYVNYYDLLSAGVGSLHIVNTQTRLDTLIATNATDTPTPAWSADSQHLIYSTGKNVLVTDVQAAKVAQPLKLQGSASAFSWSSISPSQLVLSINDGQQGIYLVDTQHDTWLQLDNKNTHGSIQWTVIP